MDDASKVGTIGIAGIPDAPLARCAPGADIAMAYAVI